MATFTTELSQYLVVKNTFLECSCRSGDAAARPRSKSADCSQNPSAEECSDDAAHKCYPRANSPVPSTKSECSSGCSPSEGATGATPSTEADDAPFFHEEALNTLDSFSCEDSESTWADGSPCSPQPSYMVPCWPSQPVGELDCWWRQSPVSVERCDFASQVVCLNDQSPNTLANTISAGAKSIGVTNLSTGDSNTCSSSRSCHRHRTTTRRHSDPKSKVLGPLCDCKIFVRLRHPAPPREDLKAYFEHYYGSVVEAVLFHPRYPRKGNQPTTSSYAFVTFESPASAERALMDKSYPNEFAEGVSKAVPKDCSASAERFYGKVFVGGLCSWTRREDLRVYFSQFGDVKDAVIMTHPQTHQPRGFGFVFFGDDALGEQAVEAVLKTSHRVGGKHVDVKRAVPETVMAAKAVLLRHSSKTNRGDSGGLIRV